MLSIPAKEIEAALEKTYIQKTNGLLRPYEVDVPFRIQQVSDMYMFCVAKNLTTDDDYVVFSRKDLCEYLGISSMDTEKLSADMSKGIPAIGDDVKFALFDVFGFYNRQALEAIKDKVDIETGNNEEVEKLLQFFSPEVLKVLVEHGYDENSDWVGVMKCSEWGKKNFYNPEYYQRIPHNELRALKKETPYYLYHYLWENYYKCKWTITLEAYERVTKTLRSNYKRFSDYRKNNIDKVIEYIREETNSFNITYEIGYSGTRAVNISFSVYNKSEGITKANKIKEIIENRTRPKRYLGTNLNMYEDLAEQMEKEFPVNFRKACERAIRYKVRHSSVIDGRDDSRLIIKILFEDFMVPIDDGRDIRLLTEKEAMEILTKELKEKRKDAEFDKYREHVFLIYNGLMESIRERISKDLPYDELEKAAKKYVADMEFEGDIQMIKLFVKRERERRDGLADE